MQCAQLMDGEFFLEAKPPFDSSRKEEKFRAARIANSVEHAWKLFQPVRANTPEADWQPKRAEKWADKVELQHQADSILAEKEKLEKEVRVMKQLLHDEKQRTRTEQLRCVICKNSPVNIVFQPCGHACACKVCWQTYLARFPKAPRTCPKCQEAAQIWMEFRPTVTVRFQKVTCGTV